MEINLNGAGLEAPKNGMTSRGGKIPDGGTLISPNLKKQAVFVDKDGNQINPVTKEIIKRKSD